MTAFWKALAIAAASGALQAVIAALTQGPVTKSTLTGAALSGTAAYFLKSPLDAAKK